MDVTSTLQVCIFACGITSSFEVFELLVALHSVQVLIKGPDFIQALLHNRQKHNLELLKPNWQSSGVYANYA